MNRQKLWVYLGLLLLAGLLNLYLASSWLGSRAAAGMDRSLKDGVALVETRARAGGAERQAAALRGEATADVTVLAGKQVASSTLPRPVRIVERAQSDATRTVASMPPGVSSAASAKCRAASGSPAFATSSASVPAASA